jgi:hypothetical protein
MASARLGDNRQELLAAFERLRGAARSSTRRLADVAKDVTDFLDAHPVQG